MKNETAHTINAKMVATAIGSGAESGGKMTAIRNVTALLMGDISPEEFDKTIEVVRNAQENVEEMNISPRRQAFNNSYLNTIEAIANI